MSVEDSGNETTAWAHVGSREEIAREAYRPIVLRHGKERLAGRILELNPFRCRVWTLHDRLADYVTDETCKAEIESFSKTGQLAPALGRPLIGDHEFDVELIYGARRLFVARYLNVALRVEVREMSDREAIVAMHTENRCRKDISPYERGLSFARWIQKGHFASQDDIAHNLRISASQVSRLLKLAKLPAVIVGAFHSPSDIREGWGLDLMHLWEDDKHRDLLAQRARSISKRVPSSSAEEVYHYLTAPAGSAGKKRKAARDIVVRAGNSPPLFRVRHLRTGSALLLPLLSDATLSKICAAVAEILRNGAAN